LYIAARNPLKAGDKQQERPLDHKSTNRWAQARNSNSSRSVILFASKYDEYGVCRAAEVDQCTAEDLYEMVCAALNHLQTSGSGT
jgi:hypothetical protein